MEQQFTAENIAAQYEEAIDCVNFINGSKPENVSDEEWTTIIARKKQFLLTVLAQPFWTTEDLTPIRTASK